MVLESWLKLTASICHNARQRHLHQILAIKSSGSQHKNLSSVAGPVHYPGLLVADWSVVGLVVGSGWY